MTKLNRVGEIYKTREGYDITITVYKNKRLCTVIFDNGYTVKDIGFESIKRGLISNPYHKSIIGVGFFGVGKYNFIDNKIVYQTWKNMLIRCYDEKTQIKHPTYIGCSVDEKWLNFQNFAEWYYNKSNYKDGLQIDKDIRFKDNKIYSEQNCSFVPKEINSLLTKSNNSRGLYPIGVSKCRNTFISRMRIDDELIYLGCFSTPELAFLEYKLNKEKHIKFMAEKHKNSLEEDIYINLLNYEVLITD